MKSYQASALQDRFVDNILKFKSEGSYLDIGSCDAVSCNNTYCFDPDWIGTCIEIDSKYNDSYSQRTCQYINADATKIDYFNTLSKIGLPAIIDYLSLDIDTQSTEVLKLLPFDIYRFRIITIEHDFYIHGDKYRSPQRRILTINGYTLLCSNVLIPPSPDTKPDCPFEDWWIYKDLVDTNLQPCDMQYPSQILELFK